MAEHAHGPVVGLVDDLLEPSCHTGFDDRAFGQATADDAIAVLVAAPMPGTVGVGEVRVHAQLVAQPDAAGELGAVAVRDADPGGRRQRGEHRQLRPDSLACGFVWDDAGHEATGLAFDLGVQVASDADHAVGLPMAEPAPVVRLRRAPRDGDPSGDREPRCLAPHAFAVPPVAARQAAGPACAPRLAGIDPPVDGLGARAHNRVVREQNAQPAADQQQRPASTRPFSHPRPQAAA